MSVLNFMEVQKQRIRLRHIGDELFLGGEGETLFRPAEQILKDINAMPGLNLKERAFYQNAYQTAANFSHTR